MSEPVRRTVNVLEYFADHPGQAFTQAQIAEACDISAATLNRIIRVLTESGYVFRDESRRYRCNLVFRRLIGADTGYFDVLARAISAIVAETSRVAEAIVVRGNEFEWHHRDEDPDTTVRLRARPGFRRSMNELDALSRLYLAEIGWDEVERRFDTEIFYRAGAGHERVTAEEARAIVTATDPTGVAYDLEGNGRGVRRFAAIVRGPRGEFLHMLAIAEGAVPLVDEAGHVRHIIAVLTHWRDELTRLVRKADTEATRED